MMMRKRRRSDDVSNELPDIKPRMVDGVAYCDAGCPCAYDFFRWADKTPVDWLCRRDQVNRDHTDLCPVWAARMAAWAEEAREWMECIYHHHPHIAPEKLLRRYPGGNDQTQDGDGGE
jgi:hypothetical protein